MQDEARVLASIEQMSETNFIQNAPKLAMNICWESTTRQGISVQWMLEEEKIDVVMFKNA